MSENPQSNPNTEPNPVAPVEPDPSVSNPPVEPDPSVLQGTEPPVSTEPATTPSPEPSTPAEPVVAEPSIEEAQEKVRLDAAKEMLEVVESNPLLRQQVLNAMAGVPVTPLPTGTNGKTQPTVTPTATTETPEPKPQDFMPEGHTYDESDALVNVNSSSYAAKEKALLARQDWVVDRKYKDMESRLNIERREQDNARNTNEAIQNIQTKFKLDQDSLNKYYADLSTLMKGGIPLNDIMERLHRGNIEVFNMEARKFAVAMFEKWKGDPEYNPTASVVQSPGAGDPPNPETEKVLTAEERVANAGNSFVI